jgi:hypothetical protein
MDSPADESNSLAKESAVFRQFSTRFKFRIDPGEFRHYTRFNGTYNVSDIVVFGKYYII